MTKAETGVRAEARSQRPPAASNSLTPEHRLSLQKVLHLVYNALNDLEEESNDPKFPNRGIIDPFIELPHKWDYPDYYQLIKAPICMNMVKQKIDKEWYDFVRSFYHDLVLLCNNCRTYNEQSSLLYEDANFIEATATNKLREITAIYPEWQNSVTAEFVPTASQDGEGAWHPWSQEAFDAWDPRIMHSSNQVDQLPPPLDHVNGMSMEPHLDMNVAMGGKVAVDWLDMPLAMDGEVADNWLRGFDAM